MYYIQWVLSELFAMYYIQWVLSKLFSGPPQLPSARGRVYRIRSVPCDWNRDDLRTFLVGHVSADPIVRSLAQEIHGRSQTATVSFQSDSLQLQEHFTKSFWKIPLSSLPNQPTRASNLVLYCDFNGITTLYAPCLQDHHVE